MIGGNGFIGSHLVDKLLQKGHAVRVLDRSMERFRAPLSGVDYRIGNISDPFSLDEAFEGVDILYHLASSSVPSTSVISPTADASQNLIPTIALLEEIVKSSVKRIVFLSSGGSVYGNPSTLPIPETHPLMPISSYGIVKMAIEKYLFMYQELHGLKPVILRPSNAYGPRQNPDGVQGVVSSILKKAFLNETIRIWGDGSIIRDYVYVEDLVECCYLAGISDQCGVFNVGSSVGFSITQLIDLISRLLEKKLPVVYEPERRFDPHSVVLDIKLAKKALNWSPQVSLEEGVRRHSEWLRDLLVAR